MICVYSDITVGEWIIYYSIDKWINIVVLDW